MSTALLVNLDKIRYNTVQIVQRCRLHGISILGVTKGFSAISEIVQALIDGGVDGLADARLENIVEMRAAGFLLPITLLRIPRLSNVEEVIRYTDTSVNSEMAVIAALGQAALKQQKIHQIILMVDVGDLREGVLLENALRAARIAAKLPGIKLVGLGTNMGCFGGVLPSITNLSLLTEITRTIEKTLGIQLDIVSGGGTSSLFLVETGQIPAGVNQLRIGEGILLGTDTTNQRKIPGLYTDAFQLRAEIIELKSKPSVPIGEIGRDAFGNIPQFEDVGNRKRAILAMGRQDVYIEGLTPVVGSMKILGASSDHLIVDVTDSEQPVKVGGEILFNVNYAGLLSASQSRYIQTEFIKKG